MQLNFTYNHNIFRYSAALLVVLFIGTIGRGQAKFSTAVSTKEVGLDDYLQVDYTIENAKSVDNFSPPDFKNFKVLQGPSQSENVTIINGTMSRSKSISYILQPTALGKQIVPGAMAVIDGKTIHSEPVTIQVNKHGSGQGQSSQANQFPLMPDMFQGGEPGVEEEYRIRPGENVKDKIAKNLIVKLDVNRTTCYEGESLVATYKLCSRVKSESRITKRPSLNGFSVYDMVQPGTEVTSVEKVNGKNFNVHLIRRAQLFPLQAGSYTLDPVVLENKVEFLKSNSSSSSRSSSPIQQLMDRFFNQEEMGEVEQHSITLQSNPVTITVRPLPTENRPDGFNGAVGKFTIKADLKNKTVAAGDAVQLEVVIKGAGNFPVINAPEINLPSGIESFDPIVKEDVDKTVYPLSGSKTFNYTFIAHSQGDFTIPPVQFSYFDPASASYKIISSDSFRIKVTEGRNKNDNLLNNNKVTATKLTSSSSWVNMLTSQAMVMAMIILLLSGIIIYLLIKNRKQHKETAPAISTPASKEENQLGKITIANPLQEARLALMQGKSQVFYTELNKALRGALEKDIENEELRSIIKECEFALYTPVHEAKDMQLLLDKAEKCLNIV